MGSLVDRAFENRFLPDPCSVFHLGPDRTPNRAELANGFDMFDFRGEGWRIGWSGLYSSRSSYGGHHSGSAKAGGHQERTAIQVANGFLFNIVVGSRCPNSGPCLSFQHQILSIVEVFQLRANR